MEGVVITGGLWSELGTTMRSVRGAAGVSLRELEARGSWRRSTISQVENGKARPSRQLVEWYDTELGSDGLLLSIYAEARSRQLLTTRTPVDGAGDIVSVIDVDPPVGHLVNRGARIQSSVTLHNGGENRWKGRALRRMGAFAGLRLIGSAQVTGVADTGPGETRDVVLDVRAPSVPGTVVAYWTMIDCDGRETAPLSPPIAVLLVVD